MGIKLINLLTRIRILKEKNNEKYINKIKRICIHNPCDSQQEQSLHQCDKKNIYHSVHIALYIFRTDHVIVADTLKPLWARKMGIKLINLLTRIRILKEKNNEKYINKIKRKAVPHEAL